MIGKIVVMVLGIIILVLLGIFIFVKPAETPTVDNPPGSSAPAY